MAVAAALDAPVERQVRAHPSRGRGAWVRAGNAAGAGRTVLPLLAGAEALGWAAGWASWRRAVEGMLLAYALGDGMASVGKPLVGRHRPGDGGSPWRFRPGTLRGDAWHSLPSGHAMHAFALAGALASAWPRPAVRGVALGTAVWVGLARVFAEAHWTSDVVASGLAGWAVGRVGARARARLGEGWGLAIAPGTVAVVRRFGGVAP